MLGEGPCFPFFPHLIGEENDKQVVHYDEGKDALAAMPKTIMGEISPKASATLWGWFSSVPIDLKMSRRSHSEATMSKTMTTGGKRLAAAAKPPASSQIGKKTAPSRKNARGLHLGSDLTDFTKSAGNFFAATTSNVTTMLERISRSHISVGQ